MAWGCPARPRTTEHEMTKTVKYLGFFRGQKVEVEAPSRYEAQQAAAKHFGVARTKAYHVAIALAGADGQAHPDEYRFN